MENFIVSDKKDQLPSIGNFRVFNKGDIRLPDLCFDIVIIMNSKEFYKICREMNQFTDEIKIMCDGKKLYVIGEGDWFFRETVYDPTSSAPDVIKIACNNTTYSETVGGIFNLENLVQCGKLSSLCYEIEIYMKHSYPMVIKYQCGTLGHVLACISPIDHTVFEEDEEEEEEDEEDGVMVIKI